LNQKELIAGCIRGDRQCQKALFQQYSGKLLAVCIRYTRHRMEAEDVLQDAFIKIFKNLEKFEGKGSFEGWMRRIVVNTALKNYNKNTPVKRDGESFLRGVRKIELCVNEYCIDVD